MNIHINNSTVMLRRSVGTGFYSLAVQNAVCIQRIFFFSFVFVLFFFFLCPDKWKTDHRSGPPAGIGSELNLQVHKSHLYGFFVR